MQQAFDGGIEIVKLMFEIGVPVTYCPEEERRLSCSKFQLLLDSQMNTISPLSTYPFDLFYFATEDAALLIHKALMLVCDCNTTTFISYKGNF